MRLDINDNERAVLLHAVEMLNDIHNDMMLEEVPLNLFPREGSENENNVVTPDNALAIREGLYEAMEKMVAIRLLLTKLGGKVNTNGYSV